MNRDGAFVQSNQSHRDMSEHQEIDLSARIRPAEGCLSAELDGEIVLLEVRSGTYFGLEGVGRRIWELLDRHRSAADVHEQLLQEYDVDAQQCREDLIQLLEDLTAHGLVDVDRTPVE